MTNQQKNDNKPYAVDLHKGKKYFWCSCGLSASQPFCDGSHKDSDFTPVKFEVEKSGKVFLCGCKATAKKPFCDGSHNS